MHENYTTPHNGGQNCDAVLTGHPSAIDAYIRTDWHLVPIKPGSKGPNTKGWNALTDKLQTSHDLPINWGIGLAHAYSKTMALDVDDWAEAAKDLQAQGIDLHDLYTAKDAVTVESGREGHGKLLYAMPFGIVLPSKKLIKINPDGSRKNYLEFRCGTANGLTVQDVLPPSIHPDTGQPYRWGGAGHWSRLPMIPPDLLGYWNRLIEKDADRIIPADTEIDASWDDIKSALSAIPPDIDRDNWIAIGMALHWAGSQRGELDAAFDLWDSWSAGSEGSPAMKYRGPEDLMTSWPGFRQENGRTLGTLFHLAREHGWTRPLPSAAEIFAGVSSADNGSILDRLKALSATNRLSEMQANLRNDFFVLAEMALAGMMTLFYGPFNSGKTLLLFRLLLDAIKDGRIKGEDVFYINADDNYKGLYTKARIAAEHGFQMISPQEANISPQEVLELLSTLAKSGGVNGKVVILDTLKKFTDMMSKRAQAALYETLRGLVTKGATIIIAGHTNKHRDANGNHVYEGTSDTMNDIDCAYSLYRMSEPDAETQVVEFRREKDRGAIIAKVSYQYIKRDGMSYRDMLESVQRLNNQQADRVTRENVERDLKEKYESEMLFVQGLLKDGPKNQTEILTARETSKNSLAGGVSMRSLRAALDQLTDIAWNISRNENNAKIYHLMVGSEKENCKNRSGV